MRMPPILTPSNYPHPLCDVYEVLQDSPISAAERLRDNPGNADGLAHPGSDLGIPQFLHHYG